MLITMRKYLYPTDPIGPEVTGAAAGELGLPESFWASLAKLFTLESDSPEAADQKSFPYTDPAEIATWLDGFANRQQGRMEEMKQLLALLATLTDSVYRGGADSRRRLDEVERNLRAAATDSDVRAIRSRLERCLQSVHEESAAREKQRREQLGMLDMGSASVRAASPGPKRAGSREDAISEIDKRVQSGESACVVFSFDLLDSVTERFGVRASEAVVESYLREIRMGLAAQEEIPQRAWGPRAMLLMVPASIIQNTFRLAVEAVPLQRTVPTGSRFATISLNVRWAYFDRSAGGTTAAIQEKIDEFLRR